MDVQKIVARSPIVMSQLASHMVRLGPSDQAVYRLTKFTADVSREAVVRRSPMGT